MDRSHGPLAKGSATPAIDFDAFVQYAHLAGIDLPEVQMRELHRGALLLQDWLAYLRSDDSGRFVSPQRASGEQR